MESEYTRMVDDFLAAEEEHLEEMRSSVLRRSLASIANIVCLGYAETHPYRQLRRVKISPEQKAAVLDGVEARKTIDRLEETVARELPNATEDERSSAHGLLQRFYELKYVCAERRYGKE